MCGAIPYNGGDRDLWSGLVGKGTVQAFSQETTAVRRLHNCTDKGTRTRRTFLNSTRQLEDGDRPCGILVPPCPHACVSGQVTVRWIHQFTAALRYSTTGSRWWIYRTEEYGTEYPQDFSWLSIPPPWFVFEGIRVPYHAWQPPQRSSPRRRKY